MGFSHTATLVMLAAFPAVLLTNHPGAHAIMPFTVPTDLVLFCMGVAGLLIGRRSAMRRDDRNKPEK